MKRTSTDVALYLPNLDGGGAERMMVNLASGFARRGYQTDLVLAEARGPYLEQVASEVNIVDLESSGVAVSLPRLVRYLRRHRPESLLATLNHASVVALLGCRLARVRTRTVIRESNMLFPYQTPSLRQRSLKASVKLLYPTADAHVAVSQGVADSLQDFVKLNPKNVHAIYNPVITNGLLERARLTPEHPWLVDRSRSSPPVLLGVGRLTGQKDFGTLVRAFARVRQTQKARLIILGEGTQRPNIEALAAELGVAEDVSLPGFVDNPFAFMAQADLFVLSSRFEGLPGALIQAMACGCKVVSTDCPSGPAEILKGGLAPLVPVGDAEALAQAMLETLNDPTPRPELRDRALHFSEETTIPQYLQVLLPDRQGDDA